MYSFYTEEIVTALQPHEIFVFGSNQLGIHGAGAAKTALESFGAVHGKGSGPYGRSYAIPTKGLKLETLPLKDISIFVEGFKTYARSLAVISSVKTFVVTKIGCGIAGYSSADIAPLFKGSPMNCKFHIDWKEYVY